MKSLLIGLLMLAGSAFADTRSSYVTVQPAMFLDGGANGPISDVAITGPYLLAFKGNNTVALAASTTVTFSVQVSAPTSIKPGGTATFGITAMYAGVTNSAGLTATASVQSTCYSGGNCGVTTTAVSIYPIVFMNNPNNTGRYLDIDLASIPNVYPGDIITVTVGRNTGSNTVINIIRAYFYFEPVKGWLW